MRILILYPFDYLPANESYGSGYCAHGLIEELAREHQVTVVIPRAKDRGERPAYRCDELLPPSKWKYLSVISWLRIVRLANRVRPEVVVCIYPWLAWLGWIISRRTGATFVYRSHNVEFLRLRSFGWLWWRAIYHYEQFIVRRADLVVPLSTSDAGIYRRLFGLSASKVRVSPPGWKDSQEMNTNRMPAAALRVLESTARHRLLFYGKFDYAPNREALQLLLSKVVPRLSAAQGYSYSLFICGRGLRAEDVRGAPDVHVLGALPEVQPVLREVDVVLNPVISGGGVKIKLAQALYLGKCAVSTRSGARGIARRDFTSQLEVVGDGDWDGFARAVVRLGAERGTGGAAPCWKYHWSRIGAEFSAMLRDARPNSAAKAADAAAALAQAGIEPGRVPPGSPENK